MGIFDFFKRKTSNEVWRESNGNIICPGDSCKKECDDTCPIWCKTSGDSLMVRGLNQEAILKYRAALSIAPDFKEAWVNMAAIYGGMNNHMEANKSYKAAYSIDPKYRNALFGLIISSKHLGQFKEALSYCNEYEKIAGKEEADKLREQIKVAQELGNTPKIESSVDMAVKIISHARNIELLAPNDRMPHIPEILMAAKNVCRKVFRETIKEESGRRLFILLSWGAYAGIGAVHHWNIDWDNLKKKGIAETLLEPRGAFAMDEYVLDSIGIGFNSPEGEALTQQIMSLSLWALEEFSKGTDQADKSMEMVLELMSAMYIFGMVYQMERIGMR